MPDQALVADLSAWKKRDTSFFGTISAIRLEKQFLKKAHKASNDMEKIIKALENRQVADEIKTYEKFSADIKVVNRVFIDEMAVAFKVLIHMIYKQKLLYKNLMKAIRYNQLPPKTSKAEYNVLRTSFSQELDDLETIRLMVHKLEAEIK